MSQLEFYTGLSTVWIAIAWVPYVLDRIHGAWSCGVNGKPKSGSCPAI